MLLKGFFRADAYNPDKPQETWTLIQTISTPGSSTVSLGWGKYMFELVGGGGGGGASALARGTSGTNTQYNIANSGFAGGKYTTPVLSVFNNTTTSVTIVVGGGGGGGYAHATSNSGTATGGTGGVGNNAGGTGGQQTATSPSGGGRDMHASSAGGGGGGQSYVYVYGIFGPYRASGGAGGDARCSISRGTDGWAAVSVAGGTGYNGNDNGNRQGAAGGSGKTGGVSSDASATGISGSNGYVRIYKSNLKPEDL